MFEVLVLDVGEQFFFVCFLYLSAYFWSFLHFVRRKQNIWLKILKRVNILGQKDPRKVFPTQRELFWFAQTAVHHNKASPWSQHSWANMLHMNLCEAPVIAGSYRMLMSHCWVLLNRFLRNWHTNDDNKSMCLCVLVCY